MILLKIFISNNINKNIIKNKIVTNNKFGNINLISYENLNRLIEATEFDPYSLKSSIPGLK